MIVGEESEAELQVFDENLTEDHDSLSMQD